MKTAKILVVDDEQDLADVIGLVMQDAGHEVRVVYSGNAAAREVDNFHPDVILSDVRMPDGSGVDLLNSLQTKRLPRKPVVLVMTGYADMSDQELIARGAARVLKKPVELDTLVQLVNETCAQGATGEQPST